MIMLPVVLLAYIGIVSAVWTSSPIAGIAVVLGSMLFGIGAACGEME